MQRACDTGSIRTDAATQDLPLLQLMLTSLLDVSREIEPRLWRRYLAIFLDGLRPSEPRSEVPPPIGLDVFHDVIIQSHTARL